LEAFTIGPFFPPELSLPAYLQLDFHNDIRAEQVITSGGAGKLFAGVLLNPEARKRFAFCADQIVIKKISEQETLSPEENTMIFHQVLLSLLMFAGLCLIVCNL